VARPATAMVPSTRTQTSSGQVRERTSYLIESVKHWAEGRRKSSCQENAAPAVKNARHPRPISIFSLGIELG